MRFEEAHEACRRGARIRRRAWNDESYVKLVDGKLRAFVGSYGPKGREVWPRLFDQGCDDWQILADASHS